MKKPAAKRATKRVRVLPKKMSKLIDIALTDIEKAEKAPLYAINMDDWHVPVDLEGEGYSFGMGCVVCAAGSVMAFTLKTPMEKHVTPMDMGKNCDQLRAINYLRNGEIVNAADELSLNPKAYARAKNFGDRVVMPYGDDPVAFKKDMKKLSRDLARVGL